MSIKIIFHKRKYQMSKVDKLRYYYISKISKMDN